MHRHCIASLFGYTAIIRAIPKIFFVDFPYGTVPSICLAQPAGGTYPTGYHPHAQAVTGYISAPLLLRPGAQFKWFSLA
jgi:hypothetical protein